MPDRYIRAGEPVVTYPPGADMCPEGSATAFDVNDQMCYRIYGLGVTIGDITAPIQGGFEVFNKNIHWTGGRSCCVNCYQLNGVMI